MFTISADQEEELREQRLHSFCVQLAERARQRHGETCDQWSDEELVANLKTDIRFARTHEIRRQDVMERYADLSVALGFGFGQSEAWAQEILTGFFTPKLKLEKLEREAVFIVREREDAQTTAR